MKTIEPPAASTVSSAASGRPITRTAVSTPKKNQKLNLTSITDSSIVSGFLVDKTNSPKNKRKLSSNTPPFYVKRSCLNSAGPGGNKTKPAVEDTNKEFRTRASGSSSHINRFSLDRECLSPPDGISKTTRKNYTAGSHKNNQSSPDNEIQKTDYKGQTECPICQKSDFQTGNIFKNHVLLHYRNEFYDKISDETESEDITMKCHLCRDGCNLKNEKMLIRHLALKHKWILDIVPRDIVNNYFWTEIND